MFTGLVEDVGTIRQVEPQQGGKRLTIATRLVESERQMGESLAVNGVCLTATGFARDSFTADLSPESLGHSTLDALRPGERVNLERALRLGDRLGGHLVTGHVDGVATVVETAREGNAVRLTLRLPPGLARHVAVKGSLAVDGISLTVNRVEGDLVGLAVIPHTWQATTLHLRRAGALVNVETDLLAKYVDRLLAGREEGRRDSVIDGDFLARHGFN